MSHHPHQHSASRRRLLAGALGLGGLAALAPLRLARAADFKALVCVFLYGGNDGMNTVVPMDAGRYADYAKVRAGLALPQASLGRLGTSDFGLHPALAALNPLFAAGKLAVQFNVGPLYAPLTKAQYHADAGQTALTPPSLFSHSDQQVLWESASTDAQSRTGWGGRSAVALGLASPVVSVGGNGHFGLSELVAPLVLPGPGEGFGAAGLGAADIGWKPNALKLDAVKALAAQAADTDLAGAFQKQQQAAMALADQLGPLIQRRPGDAGSNAAIDTAFAPLIANGNVTTGLGQQLYQTAKLLDVRATLGGTRQIYFAQLGGFDTHGGQAGANVLAGTHAALLKQLGDALACFQAALTALGLADSVTTFTQSDFGRTFLPNNSGGTDHAWGNHHLVFGGAVKGGLYGAYPTLALGGPDDVGVDSWEQQGRWIPTSSVDQYAATLLGWMGASDSQLNSVLPNLPNFGSARNLGFV
ncbi:DUF1501 domain-containing protein [Pelomonas aquatica]|uniref:DUF1501 domain-containing protein n=1 Tax=Pelomonas aquatica TaxID=431058 RepID=A0A9X4LFL4_9BURK|nr:DUF1501 domain-containing protein [Pelomonas aquatica]MCY4755243.1 DUF1501 domain-containing protein [Pelomonas aquatica]MDG0862552.1 DUF1501 domain-containing protein [Pelomonas aquatica]